MVGPDFCTWSNHGRSRQLAEQAIEDLNRAEGDLLLLVGDTATADDDELEKALSRIRFDGPKLFVAGNHDVLDAFRLNDPIEHLDNFLDVVQVKILGVPLVACLGPAAHAVTLGFRPLDRFSALERVHGEHEDARGVRVDQDRAAMDLAQAIGHVVS